MAREIAIIVHCDVCEDVLPADVKSIPPLDLGDGYRELDLCDQHRAALWTPLHDVYFDAAKSPSAAPATKRRTPGRKRRGVDDVDCTVNGCTHVFRNREDARRHMISVHHTTIGLEQARLGHGLNGDPITHRCDECKEAYVTGQELGQHNKAVHGLKK